MAACNHRPVLIVIAVTPHFLTHRKKIEVDKNADLVV